ncbi:MAG TPA: ABC transporter substrate-binding protein [Bacteroidia bacterium]|nr:ABC transporter substrate-binding protein [Bacteroidia bacterium]
MQKRALKNAARALFPVAFTWTIAMMCGCGGGDKVRNDSRQVFRFNELGDVTSLDPAMAGSFENNWALNQLYNGLVEMDSTMNVQPVIAKSWNISDDGMTYTFHLRTDISFQDDPQFPGGKGRKVTAGDFVFSFDRLFDKKVSSASTLVDIIDHDPGKAKDGIEARDDSTLEIHLRQPFKPFLGILTMKYFSVVPKEVVNFYGDGFGTHPVGTGPFMLKFWKDKMNLVLRKNPNYFRFDANGTRLPYLDIVSVTFIKDPEAAFLQFMSGQIDMLSGIDAINKEKVLEKNGELKSEFKDKFTLQQGPFLKTDYLGILVDENIPMVHDNPLRIKYLRQAINYAIDRDKLVRYRRYNLGTPATSGFIPPEMHAYDTKKLRGFSYDPDKARELLDMAGFPGGKGLQPVVLTTTSSYLDIVDEVAHQLNDIGIPAKVEILPPITFKSAVADSKVMVFRKSWICDYPDPENFMSLFYSRHFSPEGTNYTHLHDSEFDGLYERCLTEQNDSIRSDLFLRMDQILVEQSPVIPLYYDRIVRLLQKNVSGLGMDPTNTYNLERVKKI